MPGKYSPGWSPTRTGTELIKEDLPSAAHLPGAITALLITYGGNRSKVPVKAVIDLWGAMYGRHISMKKGDPLFLVIPGENDRIVPYRYTEELTARAKEVGIPFELKVRGAVMAFG